MSAAFMVAAAARDTEEDLGDSDWLSGGVVRVRDWKGEEDVERDGGRELRSGGMIVGMLQSRQPRMQW